ncbi:Adaptive-response sensory-kinase SasA [subsurface metagenome]
MVADHKLPGMSGLELCREMLGRGFSLPLVLMTGVGTEHLAVEALKAGVNDYIIKDSAQSYLKLLPLVLKDAVKKHNDQLARKKAEAELSRRNELIESIVDNLPIGLAIHSMADGAARYMNRRFLDICGWSKGDIGNIDELFDHLFADPVYRKEVKEKAITYILNDDPLKMKRENVKITTKNGEQKIITHIILPVMQNLLINIVQDTTELKALQAQLIRSERLAATGQLAASIAHEINSPLQAITLMLSDITERCRENNELMASAGLLKEAYGSIRNTVKNLLDFNRPGGEQKQPTDVNIVIQNNLALLNSHLKRNKIKINLSLSKKMPRIKSSPQQLGQVFLNLVTNAVEAISGVSKPKEGWKRRTGTGGEISIRTILRKDTIVITVSDTGPGIAEEDFNYIFDPFFTRKKKMGIGIGLSTCHGIIKDHDGTIGAKNSPDGGAVLTIKLPVG